jgi:signal transduction histidine kinase
MLYNLLSNAIGFSEPGGRIALSCGREDQMIAFSVEDEGAGIPADYQQAVFDRFESRSRGSRHRGAGLGLSIVKTLAELHGGTVALTSVPGRGTCVTVRLPLTQEAPGQVEIEEPLYKSSRAG